MADTWCAFCAKEIPDDRLTCDQCRPMVKQLNRKQQRIFAREEKRLKEIAELRNNVARLAQEIRRQRKADIEKLLRVYKDQKKE